MQNAITATAQSMTSKGLGRLMLLTFFLSGVSALAYQLCWQRALYALIGVDVDSVTIVVSVFMFGIGIGGLLGGRIADRFPGKLVRIYAAIELAIGVYGLLSLSVVAAVLQWAPIFASDLRPMNALGGLLLLLVPTTLMGMTLPILTIAFNVAEKNIGYSVGTLYFANTAGAAVGALALPFSLFAFMNLEQVVQAAAALNLVVAATALMCKKFGATT